LAFQIADDILDSHGGELSTAAEWSQKEPKQADPSVVGIVVARERLRDF
jgi:geranylgeranyl pyrophosphate synthase